jgi:hypothetical protein
MQEFRLLSTSGILGYGFPEASLQAGIQRRPDMIGVDGGSVDPGPHYLGCGKPFCSTMAIRRDLRLMLRAAVAQHIPMLIGTCGGAGGEPHLQLVVDLVRDIAREEGLHFPMAVIHAEQNKADVARWVGEGRTRPLAHQPPLDTATVRAYGHDGVMAEREPIREIASHELGFVVEAVADDQEIANAVVAIARTNMLHTDFPGRLCREGNMAFPFSPSDIEVGAMYRFSVFHTVAPDDPLAMFPIEHERV